MTGEAVTAKSVVHVERASNGVAVVRLDNPKVNALSRHVLGEIQQAAERLRADPPGAVVVTGGDKLFAAGAEIAEFVADPDDLPTALAPEADLAALGRSFLTALDAVAAIPRATIAAVSGFALGGGCELALACDFRVASTRAQLGQPEVLLGIIPGGGATQRLARLIGPARAKDLVFSGRRVGATEALAMGLVDEVVEPDELHDRAMERAAELAAGAVAAQAIAKRVIDAGLETTIDEGLELEQKAFVESFATRDAEIGVNSFLEHGPGRADFTGG